MNDQELRALVRDAVARHLGSSGAQVLRSSGSAARESLSPRAPESLSTHSTHASHVMYRIINVGESCVIEPSVTCNHCGYCKSHGH